MFQLHHSLVAPTNRLETTLNAVMHNYNFPPSHDINTVSEIIALYGDVAYTEFVVQWREELKRIRIDFFAPSAARKVPARAAIPNSA